MSWLLTFTAWNSFIELEGTGDFAFQREFLLPQIQVNSAMLLIKIAEFIKEVIQELNIRSDFRQVIEQNKHFFCTCGLSNTK